MFKRLKERFAKPKPKEQSADTPNIEDVSILYEQVIMDDHTRHQAFTPGQSIDLDRIYVYLIEHDPYRLLLKPIVFQKVKVDSGRFFKMDSRTVDITPEAYTFDEDNPVDGFISNILGDIKKGKMPASLEKNDAIRTVNELNAERQHVQKKYNVKAIDDLVFEYKTLKEVVDMITENSAPDHGIITS